MKLVYPFIIFIILVTNCYAGEIDLYGLAGGGRYSIPVTSYAERRFKTVFKQQYDFSCGSAALATLLTFHYDDPVNEQAVFVDMYKYGDQKKIQKLGFSLLDMKLYLERKGYKANGFKIDLDGLVKIHAPAITIINNKGYMHFIIIKGVSKDNVLIGDPAVGIKVMPRDKFVEMWDNRILFLIQNKLDIAYNHFQSQEEWALVPMAPLDTVVDRESLAKFNLLQLSPRDF